MTRRSPGVGMRTLLGLTLAGALFASACEYVVIPPYEGGAPAAGAGTWSAVATKVEAGASGLHVEIALRNDTGDWSEMHATSGKPAVLTTDGGTVSCDTVAVGTGGHRLAPGFRLRGYTAGTKASPKLQLVSVDCAGATSGKKLSLEYAYVTGEFNYYVASKSRTATLEVALDKPAADLTYPVAAKVEGLVEPADGKIAAINDCTLELTGVQRTDTGLEMSWKTTNPGDYPTYVHIGMPPVIGADGILYGVYESPHLSDAPITPSKQTAEWTTKVAVPKDVTGLYLLVSVESRQQKLFVSHAIDITST